MIHIAFVLTFFSVSLSKVACFIVRTPPLRSCSISHIELHSRRLLRCSKEPDANIPQDSGIESDNKGRNQPSPGNVDLFAVGAGKKSRVAGMTIKPVSPPVSSTIEPSVSKNIATSTSMKGVSLMELQAEMLRLEAEKEQILIDEGRIEQDRARLRKIDALIEEFIASSTDGQNKEAMSRIVQENKSLLSKDVFFRLAELANVSTNPEERQSFLALCDTVMESVMDLDKGLHAEITSDIQKELDMELNRLKDSQNSREVEGAKLYDQVLQQWVQQTMSGADNSTMPGTIPGFGNSTLVADMGRSMIRFPAALPLTMLPLMLKSPEISSEDLEVLKTAIFEDVLNNTIVDYSSLLVTFRGTPVVSAQETFKKVQARIELVPGLRDRVRVFMLPEYRVDVMNQAGGDGVDNTMLEKYSGTKFEPIFAIVSKSAIPRETDTLGYAFLAFGAIASLVTTFIYATDVNSLNADFVQRMLDGDTSIVDRVLIVTAGIMALQLIHDLSHWVMASVHKAKLEVPFVLPSLQIGCFGSVTRFSTFVKNRKELFDIAIAGPSVGILASLAVFFYGLDLTSAATPEMLEGFPAIPAGFLRSSFLLYETANSVLGLDTRLADNPALLIGVHPLVTIGASGVFANALNMMPIGRLDGGRVAMAVGGRQAAAGLTNSFLIGLAVSFFANPNPILLFWSVFVVLFQRGQDLPPEDDVTPVASTDDDNNKGLAWFGRAAVLGTTALLSGATILSAPVDPAIQAAEDKANAIRRMEIERNSPAPLPFSPGDRIRAPPPKITPPTINDNRFPQI